MAKQGSSVRRIGAALAGAALALAAATGASAAEAWPTTMDEPWPLGLLQPENLAKKHPKPSFDMTGTWTLKIQPENGGFNFSPVPKLTPAAQALYDQAVKANAEGKAFRDDTGMCWPAGMPKWWTRVWPIQVMQYPTGIVMIQGLFNAVRWLYLDGRGHPGPDILINSFQGDSVARWEGDTLVVDTIGFGGHHHWIIQGVPASDQLHIVERIKMAKDKQSFTVELIMTDPVNWEGEWRNTKLFVPVKGNDVFENACLPDINERITAAVGEHQAQ